MTRSVRFARVWPAILAAIVMLGQGPVVPARAGGSEDCWNYSRADAAFLNRINETRARRELRSLRIDPELSKVARVHTREMIQAGRLVHTRPRVLHRRVTGWVDLNENVGVGDRVARIHRTFMDSRPHRANILGNDFVYVGVGAIRKSSGLWVTVIFESRRDPGTRLQMPDC